MTKKGLKTKTATPTPDLSAMCADTHRQSVIRAIRSDAIERARGHLRKGGNGAGALALAELVEAEVRLARLGADA